ncbi:hypothetical protein [Dongshaea marina]|uniref:hypothetical protein n=1 Tax=Dongshaea marina TaxID=2047966 RepID=UPI00131EE52E|nr:hypothetical protein [Dongshaea marina]
MKQIMGITGLLLFISMAASGTELDASFLIEEVEERIEEESRRLVDRIFEPFLS